MFSRTKIYAEQMQLIASNGLSQPPLLDPEVEGVISIIRDEQDPEVSLWETEVSWILIKKNQNCREKYCHEMKA